MKARVCFHAVAAIVLFVASESARGGDTNLVYTYAGHFNLKIPADPDGTRGWMKDAELFVPNHILISDLNVLVNIRHTSAFDLQLFLGSPSGRIVNLAVGHLGDGYYAGDDYMGTTFDDEADTSVVDAGPPFTGSFRPREALTAFDGQDACGTWTFGVYDSFYGDTGCFESFVLTITGFSTEGQAAIPAPAAGGLALLGLTLAAVRRRCRR